MSFTFPARHVQGNIFADSQSLAAAFHAEPVKQLTVTLFE
jgi:hypothetical protein